MRTLRIIRHELKRNSLLVLMIILVALSFLVSFLGVSIVWYIYELITIGGLDQNMRDTIIAVVISIVLAPFVADILSRGHLKTIEDLLEK